ncbi:MAG: DUF6057 family protein [Kiritimatiellae bacterium]|nr:DUF6057 family protein [Kiritimatiellia bacterium]
MDTLLAIRAVAWKIADQTLVFADWDGFREMALPGDRPAGFLRWCARMAASLGLFDATWWIPYVLGALALGASLHFLVPPRASPADGSAAKGRRAVVRLFGWCALGFAVAFLPLALCGDLIWDEREKPAALFNLFGMVVSCGLFAAFRPLCNRLPGLLASCAACAALVVPFGLYAPLAGIALAVRAARRTARPAGPAAFCGVAAAVALSLAALPASCALVYDDLACSVAFPYAMGLRVPRGPVGVLRHALEMERRVRARDWRGVMDLADAYRAAGKDFPLRMEIAFRILAQFHLQTLPDDLFRHPIRTGHFSTDANQQAMDGYLLLFEYGLLQPARRSIYERVFSSGWEPAHHAYLGDVALLLGERLLAYRNYRQLRRCPFRRAFAEARLAAITDPSLVPREELGMVAAAHSVWLEMGKAVDVPFFATGDRIEHITYNFFRTLRKAPEFMARMLVSVLLLDGDAPVLAQNVPWLDRLAPPPKPWPEPVQEALLAHASTLDDARQREFLARMRPDAFAPGAANRLAAFKRVSGALTAASPQKEKDRVRRDFGDTYFFYDCWVRPGTQRIQSNGAPDRLDAEGR